jgi:hypothetical protein
MWNKFERYRARPFGLSKKIWELHREPIPRENGALNIC